MPLLRASGLILLYKDCLIFHYNHLQIHTTKMEGKQVSLLAQFDDLCRGFNFFVNGSDKGCWSSLKHPYHSNYSDGFCWIEFFKFASQQEECRRKWLMAEEELVRMQCQLNESNKLNSKLELQIHHTTVMLKDEIKVRQRVQQEKKNLVISILIFLQNIFTTEQRLGHTGKTTGGC